MSETRTLHFTTKMVVSFKKKEGKPQKPSYTPQPRKITKPQTKDFFNTDIDTWKEKVEKLMYDKYYQAALDEAEGMGTDAYLESFELYDVYTKQTGKPEKTPEQLQAEEQERLQMESQKVIELYEKERQRKLLKEQQKKEKAKSVKIKKLEKEKEIAEKEQKQEEVEKKELEIEAIKEEKPIPVKVKKELTGTDIAHIRSAEKKISKLNEIIKEQTTYLNVALGAVERHTESGRKDLLLGAIIDRDKALDMIKLQNEKIRRLQESITKTRGT